MFFKKLLPLIITASLLSACSDFSSEDSAAKAENESSAEKVSLKINFDKDAARTALPQVDTSSLIYIALSCNFNDTSKILGEWTSEEAMRTGTIEFQTGKYKFDLVAKSKSVTLYDSLTAEIKNGENSLTFAPKFKAVDYTSSGNGNLNVKVAFDGTNVKKVTGGLYYIDGTQCAGYNDEELEISSGGECTYSKSGDDAIPSGNYIVIFKFYADEERTKSLGNYREYASIAGDMTSLSVCQISSLASLYKIEYEYNGGSLKGSYTAPGSYTRRTDTITLPAAENLVKTDWQFIGWYDNQDFNGTAITEIPSGSTGNKKFYAKWHEEKTITFVLDNNQASMDETKKNLTVLKGTKTVIPSARELKIVNPSDRYFHGWSTKSTSQEIEYDDGDEIEVDDNIVLHAVWAVSAIDTDEDRPDDKRDYDADGLTDWEEVYKYFTDPSSKDTDGDGWTDGEEKELYSSSTKTFSPLIADTPDLQVVITGDPSIGYTYSLGTSGTESTSESISGGKTGNRGSTNTSTYSHSVTSQWSEKFGFSITGGLKAGWEIHAEESYGRNNTNGDSYTYSQNQSDGWSQSWSNGKSKSESKTKTLTSASIKVPIKLKNPSPISYNVKSITFSITRVANNTTRDTVPIVTIQKNDVGTIAPGDETKEFFISEKLPNTDVGQKLEELLKYSNGFKVEIVGYTITMFKSGFNAANDFTQALTKVKAKTASVYIDCGPESGRSPKTYNIAVKGLYNPHASSLDDLYQPVTLKYVFDKILKLTPNSASGYELGDKASGYPGFIKSIYGITNKKDLKNGAWYIGIQTVEDERNKAYLYTPSSNGFVDLESIILKAGDQVSIIYDVDKDGDGILRNEELIRGTSDEKEDSDGDGLSDYKEIYGWYEPNIGLDEKYSTVNKVHTNPCSTDTDGDKDVDYNKKDASNGTQDKDPMVAKYDTRITIKHAKYALQDKEFKTFDLEKENSLGSIEANINYVDSDSLYFDIEIDNPFGIVDVSTDTTEEKKWEELRKDADGNWLPQITPKLGENVVYVRCRVPNGAKTYAEKVYPLKFKSRFKTLNNIIVAPKADGKTDISWDSYSDSRLMGENSGLVLKVVNRNKVFNVQDFTYSDAVNAQETVSDTEKSSYFFVRLTKKLKGGVYSDMVLAPNTNYQFLFYAYTGKTGEFTYRLVGHQVIKTGKSTMGKLTFWMHYVQAVEDHDGAYNPNYYWNISDSSKLGVGSLTLSRDKTSDMNDSSLKYRVFGGSNSVQNNLPTKFDSYTSSKFEAEFSRNSYHTFEININAWERDRQADDDQLGTSTLKFYHYPSDDSWRCVCYISHHGDSRKAFDFKQTYDIYSGECTGKNNKPSGYSHIWNSDDGAISFYWDFAWD